MAVEHFFAVQTDLHRPVEQQRRLGDDDLVVEGIALATEAAAVRRGNDADVRRRHRQGLGEGAVQVVRGLRARIHDQLAVRIPQCHRGVLFDRQVRVAFEEEHVVEHMVGAVDRLIDVAELERHGLMHVAVIAVFVNAGLVVGQAIRRRREGAQRFVVDVDQIDRRSAVASSRAMTAATGSPTKRTLSRHNACSSWLTGRMPYEIGKASPVSTR